MSLLKRLTGLDNTNKLETGTIHAYDAFKGFGFIRRSKGKDVFFLYDEFKQCETEPSLGDIVNFEITIKKRGPAALNIVKIGSVEI